jgi:hypothetical protein
LLAVTVVAEALLTLMLVALLFSLTSWQPQQHAPEPAPQSAASELQQPHQQATSEPLPHPCPWLPPCWPELEALTVAQLRTAARAAGLPRSLTRTGHRAELLPALAGLAMAW